MRAIEIIFLALGISMDAFTVSLSKGLTSDRSCKKTALICGTWFTIFQIIFPLFGYFLGLSFADYIETFDHYIIFAIFFILGANLIKEGFSKNSKIIKKDLSFKSMFFISLATSIDSLAVGITLALVGVNIVLSLFVIGILTFCVSVFGVYVGHKFGKKYKKQSVIVGGIILILLGIEILIQHLIM